MTELCPCGSAKCEPRRKEIDELNQVIDGLEAQRELAGRLRAAGNSVKRLTCFLEGKSLPAVSGLDANEIALKSRIDGLLQRRSKMYQDLRQDCDLYAYEGED